MSKVAKLVTISLMTRVVVDENATDEQILEVARPKFIEKVNTELGEHLEEIVDDDEMPYGSTPEEEIKINIENIINATIKEARERYPIGTTLVSLFGAIDEVTGMPYMKDNDVFVPCKKETRLIFNGGNWWADIIE